MLKRLLSILKFILIFALLTLTTQVGGLVYLAYNPLGIWIKRQIKQPFRSWAVRMLVFSGMMVITSLVIVPPIARKLGRVPLPWRSSPSAPLQPIGFWVVLANRNYVKPELKAAIEAISSVTQAQDPGTVITYLDAGFPFWDGFPLWPHLSHYDGKKLDIGFVYRDVTTGKRINQSPALLGYGFSELPAAGEYDRPAECAAKGYWQYSLLRRLTGARPNCQFDASANKALLQRIAADERIRKILLEPHLKTRLGLTGYVKIRLHGCNAVRHDDHIHIEI